MRRRERYLGRSAKWAIARPPAPEASVPYEGTAKMLTRSSRKSEKARNRPSAETSKPRSPRQSIFFYLVWGCRLSPGRVRSNDRLTRPSLGRSLGPPAGARTTAEREGGRAMRPKILVVDDDTSQAEQTRFVLESQGFDVAVAQGGKEGLVLAREERPAAIVSDEVVSNIDG